VEGEDEYRNKGVAYCPHCDGPLFHDKKVVVVGGGNSGVEAAIDLAGIAQKVTLLEFDSKLRADQVLQKKLYSFKNIDVILNAKTQKIYGDGKKVSAIEWMDRTTNKHTILKIDGVFVQIGLTPNTSWLNSTVKRNDRGEICINEKGETSANGIFAAGDATTVPYKQIVIAMGSGATASLSAFDYLIRNHL